MSNDETELIARIVNGDTEAYRTVVDHYTATLYRHCFYIMRDEDTAEDMAQEAFIQAYRHLSKYDPEKGSLKSWLLTIATRRCLSELRRNRAVRLMDDDIVISPLRTEQYAKEQEVHDAVLRLKPKYRTVVTLHYWHGYSYAEIAAAMEVPIGSVRGWLYRAKQQLKEALL